MKKFLRYLGAGLLIVSALGGPALSAWTFNVPYHPDQAVGDLLYISNAKSGTMTSLAAGTSGYVLQSNGAGTAPSWSSTVTGDGSGLSYGFKTLVTSAASGTTNLTAGTSGSVYVNTGTSGTTTFTLPSAAQGQWYCFIEAGDAAGELLINVQTGDSIVGKTHGAENGTGISTAAGTGIKNTAATNVKGDHTCVVAIDTTSWLMYSVAGVWASQ